MSGNIETIILSGLLYSDEFTNVSLPHIKPEYFESVPHKNLFKVMQAYQSKYVALPNKEAMEIELGNHSLSEGDYQSTIELISKITGDNAKKAVESVSVEWLKEKAEKYCLDRSVYLGIMESINIIDGTNKKAKKDSIPELLQKALAVSFDTKLGHDYLEDWESRFDFYHLKESRIETPLSAINTVTKGGFPRKTLNLVIAPTGVGKTHIKTFFASDYLMKGLNVLYVTMEMAEERISERIDACLMDVSMDNLKKFPKSQFGKKIETLKAKTVGKLIVREFPTGSINTNNLRFLIDELRTKKGFVPDVLVLDYINLIGSTRIRNGDNSYGMVKAVAEELRGLAVEKDMMVLTSSQTNRSGQNASDFDLNEVSESHGLSMTADFMMGAISTEELEKLNQMRIKILKNRYGKKDFSFVVGINREKMTLFDIDIVNSLPQSNAVQLPTAQSVITAKSAATNNDKLSGFKW